jgi:hypothetical protein
MTPHPIRWLDRRLADTSTDRLLQIFGLSLISLAVSHLFLPVAELVVAADVLAFVVAWRCRSEAIQRDRDAHIPGAPHP